LQLLPACLPLKAQPERLRFWQTRKPHWDVGGRVHYVLAPPRLQAGKVLIERDGIEYGIARDLQGAGIPAADIVTAWRRLPERQAYEAMAA
jgi:hypothetical protein